jgi:hypothetical protein
LTRFLQESWRIFSRFLQDFCDTLKDCLRVLCTSMARDRIMYNVLEKFSKIYVRLLQEITKEYCKNLAPFAWSWQKSWQDFCAGINLQFAERMSIYLKSFTISSMYPIQWYTKYNILYLCLSYFLSLIYVNATINVYFLVYYMSHIFKTWHTAISV